MPPISIRFQAIAQDQPGENGTRCSSAPGPLTARGSCAAAWSGVRPTWNAGAPCANTCPNWCRSGNSWPNWPAAAMWRPASCRCGAHPPISPAARKPYGSTRKAATSPRCCATTTSRRRCWRATGWPRAGPGGAWRRWATACGARWTASTRTAWPRPVVRRAHRRGHRLRHPAGAALRAGNRAQHRPGHRHPAARAGAHEL